MGLRAESANIRQRGYINAGEAQATYKQISLKPMQSKRIIGRPTALSQAVQAYRQLLLWLQPIVEDEIDVMDEDRQEKEWSEERMVLTGEMKGK